MTKRKKLMVICLLVNDEKWWDIVFETHFCFVANQEREFRKVDKLTPPQRAKRGLTKIPKLQKKCRDMQKDIKDHQNSGCTVPAASILFCQYGVWFQSIEVYLASLLNAFLDYIYHCMLAVWPETRRPSCNIE